MNDAQDQAIRLDRLREQTRGAFAPRRTRLLLGYGYLAAVALACAGAGAGTGLLAALVQLVAVVAMVVLWVLLRRATRLVADAPEAALDELMVRLRNRAFLLAYQLLAVVVLAIACVLFVWGRAGIGESLATALAWAGFGSALGLPLVVTAVAFPEDHPGD